MIGQIRNTRRTLAALALAAGTMLPATAQAQLSWVDWAPPTTGQPANTLYGTMNLGGTIVGVTYTGPAAFYYTGGEYDYWRQDGTPGGIPWAAYDAVNAPVESDMIALNLLGKNTLTFSQSISGLYMAFVSIGQPNYGVSYSFNTPFTIVDQGQGYWGNGPMIASADGLTLTGYEGHGVIQFVGDVTTLEFSTDPSEYWHGFNAAAVTVTPEPASMTLFATGLVGLAALGRRRRKNETTAV